MRPALILCLALAAAGCKKTGAVPAQCRSFNRTIEQIGKCTAAPASLRENAAEQAKTMAQLLDTLDDLDGAGAEAQIKELGELCAAQEKDLREMFSKPELGGCL